MNKTSKPLVSIITPCWNSAHFLLETYESLQNQTLKEWEWLVTDDGSTDNSVQILCSIAQKDVRVHVFPLPHSGLPAVGRNYAMRQAQGDYFAFLDSDDLFLPEKLQQQIFMMKGDSSLGLTYTWAEGVLERSVAAQQADSCNVGTNSGAAPSL